MLRRAWPVLLTVVLGVVAQTTAAGLLPTDGQGSSDSQSSAELLHSRVDRVIEAAAVGPLAPLCTDSEFLRRSCLDLTGVIPSVSEVNAFAADNDPSKRKRLIDQLLASPEFIRHMAVQLDVMLLERRSDKHVPEADWESYLLNSIADRKPLNQLFRELIYPNPDDQSISAAAKFLLSREAEPNAVTRDVGRLALGIDLQCAQCHDHPLIDDYYQQDYFGLFAFVQRTSLFTDPASKKVRLAEKPAGEASFTSVFTGEGREWARPRLPNGTSAAEEPVFADGQEYQVAPAKNVPGVPKYSRRKVLAVMLAENSWFQRNLANRLWAMMFGRGIVHPPDVHHSANPPSNPALLNLLASELKAGEFDLRSFLQQLALTRAYQRSSSAPHPEVLNFADIAARAERLAGEHQLASAAVAPLKAALQQAQSDLAAAVTVDEKLRPELTASAKAVATATLRQQKAQSQSRATSQKLKLEEEQLRVLNEAIQQIRESASRLPDESVLREAVTVLEKHALSVTSSVGSTQSAITKADSEISMAEMELHRLQQLHAELEATAVPVGRIAELETREISSRRELDAATAQVKALESQLGICRQIAEFQDLRLIDPTRADLLWQDLTQQWTINRQIAALKPMTAEQLAASAMRAVGVLDPQIAGLKSQLEKSPPKSLAEAAETDRDRLQTVLLQLQIINQLRTTVRQFVTTYGGLPAEEFQATVGQALFFGNSSLINEWLMSSDDRLSVQLARCSDNQELVRQLYLSILSRPADDKEQQELHQILAENTEDRSQIIRELIWALLSSNEFRFNY